MASYSIWILPQVAIVALQIACAVHVFKTGRDFWWFWIILFFPLIGSIIYLVVEVYPEAKRGRAGIPRPESPRKAIRRLKEELEDTDTVENRLRLADACLEAGMHAEALSAFQPCCQGIYKDDQRVLFGLARAHFHNGDFGGAGKMLGELDRIGARDNLHERRLLAARILEQTGRTDEALKEYEALARVYPGEEASCRYALLLEKTGRGDQASAVFREIIAPARRSEKFFRKKQKEWITTARKRLS